MWACAINNYNLNSLEIFNIPEIFVNNYEYYNFVKSNIANEMLKQISDIDKDIIALGFVTSGKRVLFSKDKLTEASKFNNINILIDKTPITEQLYKKLGAKPNQINKDAKGYSHVELIFEEMDFEEYRNRLENIIFFPDTYNTYVIVANKNLVEEIEKNNLKDEFDYTINNVISYNLDLITNVSNRKQMVLRQEYIDKEFEKNQKKSNSKNKSKTKKEDEFKDITDADMNLYKLNSGDKESFKSLYRDLNYEYVKKIENEIQLKLKKEE